MYLLNILFQSFIDDFFDQVHYQGEISEDEYTKIQPYIDTLDAFTRLCNTSVYVIDYSKQNFLYVSANPLFLNGYTVEEISRIGYMYYQMFVPKEDLNLLLEISKAVFSFYYNTPQEDRMKYTISYDFHILNKEKRSTLINHKLTPMALSSSGRIWLAMCAVTLSSKIEPGEITMSKINDNIEYVYSKRSRKWNKNAIIKLSERETEILRLSSQGLSNYEIARKIFIDVNTVKFHKKNIFQTFNVKNIVEAIAFAVNRKLI